MTHKNKKSKAQAVRKNVFGITPLTLKFFNLQLFTVIDGKRKLKFCVFLQGFDFDKLPLS